MFKFNVFTKEVSHSEISEWFLSHNAEYTITRVTDVREWSGNDWQIIDLVIPDELIAIEFRLAFDAEMGESMQSQQQTIEEELLATLSADIAKIIDQDMIDQLIATTTNYVNTLATSKLYGFDDKTN